MAKAYLARGHTEPAKAALWLAAAHYNHYIDGTLSNQGLSSGERDTARDNTMLHNVYMRMAFNQAAENYKHWVQPNTWQMCGDDEICIGMPWDSALVYMTTLQMQGHVLQPRKSMLGNDTGEFLQYNMRADKTTMPQQPVCPNLINFISGSWYKTANYNAWEYPNQVSAAAASCVRRGANHDTMQRITISTCSWLAATTPWKNNLNATAFFGATTKYIRPKTVDNDDIGRLYRQLKAPAVDEYVRHIATRFAMSPNECRVVQNYAEENIYGSVIIDKRSQSFETTTFDDQPRVSQTCRQELPSITKQLWLNASVTTRYDQATWMAVQLGLPLPVITRIGLAQVVKRATNAMRKHMVHQEVVKSPCALTPQQLALLPGAIVPFFITTN